MFKKIDENDEAKRIENALILEKHFNPEKMRSVICSDILNVLSSYGDIDTKNMEFDIVILENGSYSIEFKAPLNHIKIFNSF